MTVTQLGWFGWRPRCLQSLNIPLGFLSALGITTFIHGMVVNGILNVNISTIERRFHFNSYQSGIISSVYDVTFCVLCPLVSYYGNRGNRPRIIAGGLALFTTGCLVIALPHFLVEPLHIQKNYTELCSHDDVTPMDGENQLRSGNYFYVFISAMMLIGAGSIPIITLGIAFLEDSTTKERGASYIGIVGAVSSFGSAVGFIFGGYLLSFYVDFNVAEQRRLGISSDDPTWIGAWWLSPIIAAGFSVVAMVCISSFPKQLPDALRHRVAADSEIHVNAGSKVTEKDSFGKTYRDFPHALKFILANQTFLFTTLACCAESFFLNGFAVFLPKLLQNQFHLTSSHSAFLAGSVSVSGAIFGHFTSGYLVKRFALRTPKILRSVVITALISTLITPFSLLYCPSSSYATYNVLLSGKEKIGGNLTNVTNFGFSLSKDLSHIPCNCNCDDVEYSPVCGADGLTYFSACHAGCQSMNEEEQVYESCSCVGRGAAELETAAKGLCLKKCNLLIPYLILLFILVFLSFSVLTPSFVVVLRCVANSQKSFAVGMQWFFIRVFGSIPSPLIIGAIFDATCQVWQNEGPNKGACWVYDNAAFAKFGCIVALVCKIVSSTCFWLGGRFYKRERRNDEEAEGKAPENDSMLPADVQAVGQDIKS